MAGSSGIGRLQHPRFARCYLRLSQAVERRGGAEHRRRLLAGLTGRVIEVGAGNGLNLGHLPGSVTEYLAVEPDDVLRAHAEAAAARARVPATVMAGEADALPVPDGACDAAVVSLVLCSVPDPAHALAEIRRVLRPGGELRFYEHVRSARPWTARLEDALTPLWSRAAGGCHPNRDTVAAIEHAGFDVVELDRFGFRPARGVPLVAHVLGRATRRPD